jgi:tetratricopeptide (TPR) repeat protein
MKKNKINTKTTEKTMADLTQILQEQHFKSFADVEKFMDGMVKGKKVPKEPAKDASRQAQELMYDAWETDKKSERIRLAKKALSIYPDCADAYNLLAEEDAKYLEEVTQYYKKGMEAGRRALGEETFKEAKGHFWGLLETRPYMRSCAGFMHCLWEAGEHNTAIDHAKEMLKLNPSDNQGIRYILITYLAELNRYDELEKFMNRRDYRDDGAAEWLYTRVLLSFVKNGDDERSRRELAEALQMNVHVPKYLTGEKSIPRILPDSITMGGEDEAYCYAAANINVWKKTPGVINWLKARQAIKNKHQQIQ